MPATLPATKKTSSEVGPKTIVEIARAKVYSEMQPSTQKVVGQLAEEDKRVNVSSVMWAYYRGTHIRRVMQSPEVYGENAIEQIATWLYGAEADDKVGLQRMSASGRAQLRNLAKFAEIDANFVRKWSVKPNKHGGFLTWSHWLLLSRLKDLSKLTLMVKTTINNAWTTAELREQMAGRGLNPSVSGNPAGRTPTTPASALQGMVRTLRSATSLAKWLPMFEKTTLPLLDKMPPDKIDELVVSRIRETVEEVDSLEALLEHVRPELQRALDRVETVLEKRQSKADVGSNGHTTNGTAPTGGKKKKKKTKAKA